MSSSLAWTLRAGLSERAGSWESAANRRFSGDRPAMAAETPLDELSEPALVGACLAGRPGAFDLVVARHRRNVYLLCYRFLGNHEDASDHTQEVFLRAYRGLRAFRGQSTLATWFYRIGVNVCLNSVAAKRPPSLPLDGRDRADVSRENASDRLLRCERAAQVRAAIARLPRRQRAVLILRMYHEMSHQEIAGALDSTAGAVKANFFHALANLKKLLDKDRA
ncbi:MAG: sigma-70 family RNA polymerase sigma factor [Acidobacteria bacterium]|nr:sigma-70 family RNA polymerase sigma factor [Acidobacteriota bacterium]